MCTYPPEINITKKQVDETMIFSPLPKQPLKKGHIANPDPLSRICLFDAWKKQQQKVAQSQTHPLQQIQLMLVDGFNPVD